MGETPAPRWGRGLAAGRIPFPHLSPLTRAASAGSDASSAAWPRPDSPALPSSLGTPAPAARTPAPLTVLSAVKPRDSPLWPSLQRTAPAEQPAPAAAVQPLHIPELPAAEAPRTASKGAMWRTRLPTQLSPAGAQPRQQAEPLASDRPGVGRFSAKAPPQGSRLGSARLRPAAIFAADSPASSVAQPQRRQGASPTPLAATASGEKSAGGGGSAVTRRSAQAESECSSPAEATSCRPAASGGSITSPAPVASLEAAFREGDSAAAAAAAAAEELLETAASASSRQPEASGASDWQRPVLVLQPRAVAAPKGQRKRGGISWASHRSGNASSAPDTAATSQEREAAAADPAPQLLLPAPASLAELTAALRQHVPLQQPLPEVAAAADGARPACFLPGWRPGPALQELRRLQAEAQGLLAAAQAAEAAGKAGPSRFDAALLEPQQPKQSPAAAPRKLQARGPSAAAAGGGSSRLLADNHARLQRLLLLQAEGHKFAAALAS